MDEDSPAAPGGSTGLFHVQGRGTSLAASGLAPGSPGPRDEPRRDEAWPCLSPGVGRATWHEFGPAPWEGLAARSSTRLRASASPRRGLVPVSHPDAGQAAWHELGPAPREHLAARSSTLLRASASPRRGLVPVSHPDAGQAARHELGPAPREHLAARSSTLLRASTSPRRGLVPVSHPDAGQAARHELGPAPREHLAARSSTPLRASTSPRGGPTSGPTRAPCGAPPSPRGGSPFRSGRDLLPGLHAHVARREAGATCSLDPTLTSRGARRACPSAPAPPRAAPSRPPRGTSWRRAPRAA